MKRITVFCGSAPGTDPIYHETATRVGKRLAEQGIGIVYGGGAVGLMGAVADGALAKGGHVIGILPRFLQRKEVGHSELSELILVETMHERKAQMNAWCDGFLTLPGGFGTLEELFEILTWAQLGLHGKPIGLLNVNGYYDPLIHLLNSMVDQGFLKKINRDMLLIDTDFEALLERMQQYTAPDVNQWITQETS